MLIVYSFLFTLLTFKFSEDTYLKLCSNDKRILFVLTLWYCIRQSILFYKPKKKTQHKLNIHTGVCQIRNLQKFWMIDKLSWTLSISVHEIKSIRDTHKYFTWVRFFSISRELNFKQDYTWNWRKLISSFPKTYIWLSSDIHMVSCILNIIYDFPLGYFNNLYENNKIKTFQQIIPNLISFQ